MANGPGHKSVNMKCPDLAHHCLMLHACPSWLPHCSARASRPNTSVLRSSITAIQLTLTASYWPLVLRGQCLEVECQDCTAHFDSLILLHGFSPELPHCSAMATRPNTSVLRPSIETTQLTLTASYWPLVLTQVSGRQVSRLHSSPWQPHTAAWLSPELPNCSAMATHCNTSVLTSSVKTTSSP